MTAVKEAHDGVFVSGAAISKRKYNYSKARGVCRWCKQPKTDRRSSASYCSSACRNAYSNNLKIQGSAIIAQVKRWQMAPRGVARGVELSLLEQMAREFVRMDRERGIDYLPPVPAHYHAKVVGQNIAGKPRGVIVSGG